MEPVADATAAFTQGQQPLHQHTAIWAEGRIRLSIDTFLAETTLPPTNLVTSGRCIILTSASVLVMQNPHERHILPGGRIERGEDSRTAVIREVREETGLALEPVRLQPLAVMVFQHLTPRPADYPYPYPVFTNDVYMTLLPAPATIATNDDYEQGGVFLPFDEAQRLIPGQQQVLLAAARRALIVND